MQANMKAIMAQGTDMLKGAPRQLSAANQNMPMAFAPGEAPQWYDIKQMVEIMFDAVAERRQAETVQLRYNGHPGRQLITAEIHGINMQIALAWHDYRRATAAYHAAWALYQANLQR